MLYLMKHLHLVSVSLDSLICVGFRDGMISVPMCGPMNRFTVGVSEDGSSSTLSVQSVDSVVNETTIQCVDGDVNESICIIGYSS